MEELLKILEDVRDDIDFSNTSALVSGKILTSFDIIQLISTLDDEYDISIPAAEIVPANFDTVEAIFALIQRLKG
ncbi:MAG: acyl carrier protein [Lachnospiraceae bacterium]|nr:acyl carrier protein [Lachnospiraceae bacterium]